MKGFSSTGLTLLRGSRSQGKVACPRWVGPLNSLSLSPMFHIVPQVLSLFMFVVCLALVRLDSGTFDPFEEVKGGTDLLGMKDPTSRLYLHDSGGFWGNGLVF